MTYAPILFECSTSYRVSLCALQAANSGQIHVDTYLPSSKFLILKPTLTTNMNTLQPEGPQPTSPSAFPADLPPRPPTLRERIGRWLHPIHIRSYELQDMSRLDVLEHSGSQQQQNSGGLDEENATAHTGGEESGGMEMLRAASAERKRRLAYMIWTPVCGVVGVVFAVVVYTLVTDSVETK